MNLPKSAIDILLVEDNAYEVELTLHAFSRHYPERIIELTICAEVLSDRVAQ